MVSLRIFERVFFILALGPLFHYIRFELLLWLSAFSVLFIVVRWLRRLGRKRFFMDGHVKPGFEEVADVYRRNVASGQDLGSAFAVYYKGELVVDLWGGYADLPALRYRERDNLGLFYSSTKAVTAIVLAVLADRGLLDYDAKISSYWPEFSQENKQDITVKQLLSHQAGLLAIRDRHRLALCKEDTASMSRLLAKQKPMFKPGEGIGYHTLTFGLYADQLVRRIDKQGRSLSQFFQDEIAVKFDIEFYIGLPSHMNHRAVRESRANFGWMHFFKTIVPIGVTYIYLIAYSFFKYHTFYLWYLIGNPTDWKFRRLNDPKFRGLPSGASHGFGTAYSAAKLVGILANGGVLKGKQLLSQDAISFLNSPLADGFDRTVLRRIVYGPGTVIDRVRSPDGKSHNTFGHWGAGGQMIYCDPEHNLGWAYTTNFANIVHGFVMDHRYTALHEAMYQCVYKLENDKNR